MRSRPYEHREHPNTRPRIRRIGRHADTSTARPRPNELNRCTTCAPIINHYEHGHSSGASATDRPIATDWATPVTAASRIHAPVSRRTASVVSAISTSHPNGEGLQDDVLDQPAVRQEIRVAHGVGGELIQAVASILTEAGARFHDTL